MSSFEKFTQNRFFIFGEKLGVLIMLSSLWLLFSLPLVTIGASTAALYYAVIKRFDHDSETPLQDFIFSFRQNLRQGIILTLIYLIYGALIAFDIYAARNGFNGQRLPAFYEQIAYVLLLPIAFTLPYVFSYLARFSNSIKETIKLSFMFSATHFMHTAGILLLMIASIAVMVLFPPSVLLVPVICIYLCSRMIEKDFAQAQRQQEEQETDSTEEDDHS